jgi:hypothetical protein
LSASIDVNGTLNISSGTLCKYIFH